MHSALKGQYLPINYKDWQNYTVSRNSSVLHQDDVLPNNKSSTTISKGFETASQYEFAVKIVFLVGQPTNNDTQTLINAESDLNGDLIQESFLDSYNNLTLKTIMMLKWVNTNCIDKGNLTF